MSNKIWTLDFIKLSLVNLFIFITFYTLLSTLPIYVIAELEGSEVGGGLVATLMFASAILTRPFASEFINKFGQKNVLIISSLAFSLTTLGYFFVDHFVTLLILRFIHGISFGAMTTALSVIALNILPKQRTGEGLGYFVMFTNAAIVVGPFLGLTAIQYISYQQLFILINLFVAISSILTFTVKVVEEKVEVTNRYHLLSFGRYFEKGALPVSAIGFLIAFSYSSIMSFTPIYLEKLGLAQSSGLFFLIFALAMLMSRPFIGKLFDRHGGMITILPCMIIYALSYFSLGHANTSYHVFISAALLGIGYGALFPLLMTLTLNFVPEARKSNGTSTFLSMFDLGIALGSFILGYIIVFIGYEMLYFSLALFIIVVAALFYFYKKNRKLEYNS